MAARAKSALASPDFTGVAVVVVVALWAYLSVRAARLAFTADESISWADLHGLAMMSDTANNQWLNTAGMWLTERLFGSSEFALRLPNLLSFGLYGGSVVVLVRRLRSRLAAAVCLVGLVADPFLVEFFGLARGYGLSLAFCAVALAALTSQRDPISVRREVARVVLIATAAVFAFYANFSSLNFSLAVVGVGFVQLYSRLMRAGIGFDRRQVCAVVAIAVLMLGAIAPGVVQLQHLRNTHALYYGGHTGFVQDTVGTLVQTWGYLYTYGVPVHHWAITIAWVISGTTLIAMSWAAFLGFTTREFAKLQAAAMVLALTVAGSLFETHFFGTLYPIDRTALALIPPFAMLIALSIDPLPERVATRLIRAVIAVPVALGVLLAAVNLLRVANVTSALTWSFDAPAEDAINHIVSFEHSHFNAQLPLTMIVPTSHEYALSDYYVPRKGIRWLVIRTAPVSTPGADIYEVPAGGARNLDSGARLLATLPEDGTQLWLGRRLAQQLAAREGSRP